MDTQGLRKILNIVCGLDNQQHSYTHTLAAYIDFRMFHCMQPFFDHSTLAILGVFLVKIKFLVHHSVAIYVVLYLASTVLHTYVNDTHWYIVAIYCHTADMVVCCNSSYNCSCNSCNRFYAVVTVSYSISCNRRSQVPVFKKFTNQ